VICWAWAAGAMAQTAAIAAIDRIVLTARNMRSSLGRSLSCWQRVYGKPHPCLRCRFPRRSGSTLPIPAAGIGRLDSPRPPRSALRLHRRLLLQALEVAVDRSDRKHIAVAAIA